LIQILGINARRPADAAVCAAKAHRVNPLPGWPDGAKAGPATPIAPPGWMKTGKRAVLRFTAG
jgi:hypothetical protein